MVDIQPELTVIMPARNAAGSIAESLDALVAQEWERPWEIIVVDNGSTDDTARIASSFSDRHPCLRVVDASDRAGVGHARNVGIRAALAPSVAMTDSDDIVGPHWVAAIGSALREHEYVTGPLELRRLNPPEVVDSRGEAFTRGGEFMGIFPFAHGCNLGVRRSLFERVGPFDDSFRFAEDVEFGMRVWLAGTPMHFVDEALIHYRYRPELDTMFRQARNGGRMAPIIARELHRRGGAAPSRLAGLRNWAWLVRHLPDVTDAQRRSRWVYVAGKRVGQIEGSVRARSLYL